MDVKLRWRSGIKTAATRLAMAVVLTSSGALALAESYYISPDVPTDLSAATFLASQIVRNDAGSYSLAQNLPNGTAMDALHRMDNGDWLFSVESIIDLGAVTFEPRDVIRFDGGSAFNLFFDGSATGVPEYANVDALFLDGGDAGDLILSFNVPTTIAGSTYEPADLVRFSGGAFSLFFDASAATPPVPLSSNVTGAEAGSLTLLTFDVPTTLGPATFLPGELVSWNGTSFASFNLDPSWPLSSLVNGFSLLANPGLVPPAISVELAITLGDLTISWQASCASGAEDYAIYEGELGTWYSHTQVDCSDDGGDFTENVTPTAGARYYLVVPNNPNAEGSYGQDSLGAERPIGATTCVVPQVVSSCP